jgi:aspartyl-tRNA(Asn)/glutamyl-tRNA(Gln) amidotransferase subunit A
MTFADWQHLAPADAARTVHRRAAALPPAQQRAVFAWIEDESALAARFADAAAATPETGPLARIPCLLKDVFDVAGRPTRAGSSFLHEIRPAPAADGALVRALRAHHAVVAGKTHLHEFAYGLTGENPHYGDVDHPRFPGRTSGGSSSGSAAAVAAGVVPLAFGTDTAGSIRVPAAFCGLHGFRMTPHHAWIADAFPLAPSFDTAGWFTAHAGDMAVTLRALLGPTDGEAPSALNGAWLALPGADDDVAAAQLAAALAWATPLDPGLARPLLDACAESPAAFAALRSPEAWAVHAPWAAQMAGRYSPAVYERLVAGRTVGTESREAALAVRRRLESALAAVWARHDFLVMPATPCVAPALADCTPTLRARLLAFTVPASLAALPVLTLPIPVRDGLSTGLQIIAPLPESPAFLRILERLP